MLDNLDMIVALANARELQWRELEPYGGHLQPTERQIYMEIQDYTNNSAMFVCMVAMFVVMIFTINPLFVSAAGIGLVASYYYIEAYLVARLPIINIEEQIETQVSQNQTQEPEQIEEQIFPEQTQEQKEQKHRSSQSSVDISYQEDSSHHRIDSVASRDGEAINNSDNIRFYIYNSDNDVYSHSDPEDVMTVDIALLGATGAIVINIDIYTNN